MDDQTIKQSKTHTPQPLKIVGIISSCGGGDWHPLMALAVGLDKKGHSVTLICDTDTKEEVLAAGLEAIVLPKEIELSTYFDVVLNEVLQEGRSISANGQNPLWDWTVNCIPHIIKSLESITSKPPDLLLSSLLGLALCEKLATIFDVPWCFINPSFHFGDGNCSPVKSDFSPIGAQMYRHWLLPSVQKATMVLHATDPIFDSNHPPLQNNHHYIGPLFWEKPATTPGFFKNKGAPWLLLSLSTTPQIADIDIVKMVCKVLQDKAFRILVTLTPQHSGRFIEQIPDNVSITGYIPHTKILPECSLCISHAGHGIVAKSLLFATPMVLIPWGRDQPGVAARAESLGVAKVVERENFTAADIALAVEEVLADENIAQNCREHSLRLRHNENLMKACDMLESLVKASAG